MKTCNNLHDIVKWLALSWYKESGNSVTNLTEDEIANIISEYNQHKFDRRIRITYVPVFTDENNPT